MTQRDLAVDALNVTLAAQVTALTRWVGAGRKLPRPVGSLSPTRGSSCPCWTPGTRSIQSLAALRRRARHLLFQRESAQQAVAVLAPVGQVPSTGGIAAASRDTSDGVWHRVARLNPNSAVAKPSRPCRSKPTIATAVWWQFQHSTGRPSTLTETPSPGRHACMGSRGFHWSSWWRFTRRPGLTHHRRRSASHHAPALLAACRFS